MIFRFRGCFGPDSEACLNMSYTRVAAGLVFAAIIAGTFALSEPGDLPILQKVGAQTIVTVKDGMPENDKLTGPLASFRAGDALPIEERVRVRIQNDQELQGSEVTVVPTATAGQVKLKGVV